MEKNRKSTSIQIRVSDAEKTAIMRKADACNMNVSKFALRCMLENDVDVYEGNRQRRYVASKAAYVTAGATPISCAAEAMAAVTESYHQIDGTYARHSELAFSPDEAISLKDAMRIADKAITFYEDNYQILGGVHTDTEHIHVHFVMNMTNYNDGSKYSGEKRDYIRFIEHLNQIMQPYHASVIGVE